MRRRRGLLAALATALLACCLAVVATAATVLLECCLAASSSTAWAHEADIPGVEITPAKFLHDLQGRDFAIKVMAVNHDPVSHTMDLYVTGLGHDLDGSPRFIEPSRARDAISLPAPSLVLGPGARSEMVLRGSIPAGKRSLYAAVVAEFIPPDGATKQIQVRSRVASMLLLRGPKPWVKEVEVTDVGLLPADEGVLVYAALENTGNVHVTPRGKVKIFQGGNLLDVVTLPGEIVIPGFARRLVGAWMPARTLDGPVELVAEISKPAGEGSATIYFADGKAVIPSAEITNLYAHSEGGVTQVAVLVTNTGETAIDLDVGTEALDDGRTAAKTERTVADLQPGEAREVVWEADLDEGLYLIKARASVDGRLLDESVTGLEVASAFNWLLIVALLSILANVGLFEALRRDRRNRQSVQAGAEPSDLALPVKRQSRRAA